MKNRICHCGGTMRFGSKQDPVVYKNIKVPFITDGFWCNRCEDGIPSFESAKKHDEIFIQLRDTYK